MSVWKRECLGCYDTAECKSCVVLNGGKRTTFLNQAVIERSKPVPKKYDCKALCKHLFMPKNTFLEQEEFTASGYSWKPEATPMNGLRALRSTDGTRLVIEQNPNTGTYYAERAKKGEQIAWVFDLTKPKGQQWRIRIENGVGILLAEK